MNNVEEVWEAAVETVTYQTKNNSKTDRTPLPVVQKIITSLQECELFDLYECLALENFRSDLQTRIIPEFHKRILFGGSVNLPAAVISLHEDINWYFYVVPIWPHPEKFARKMRDLFIACLDWVLDGKMQEIFAEFYAHAFQVFTWKTKNKGIPMDSDDKSVSDECLTLEWEKNTRIMAKSECEDFLDNVFLPLPQHYILDLDLLGTFAEQPVTRVMEVEIRRYVEKTCKGEYESHWLHTHLEKWIKNEVMQWLESIFSKMWNRQMPSEEFNFGLRKAPSSNLGSITDNGHDRRQWVKKLSFILYETYTEIRISEMFLIITDFPESSPAIEDLKLCLERTNQRPYLIETLRKDLSNRVLHPGVCTGDIISMYIGAVKALRLLDPSGVVMEIVLEPYTKYLTERDDAVRMIMTGLLDDDRDGSDLAMELARGVSESRTSQVHSGDPNDSFFTEELTNKPEDWHPDPREADPEKPDKSRRTSDIISLLVGMYGSKNRFIKEYEDLLSRRLLSNWCAGTSEESEIKNLELLKLRFGEDNMGKCAVMLKDVTDSRRINTYVRDDYLKQVETKPEVEVSVLVISSEYWPDLQAHDMTLPNVVHQSFNEFNKGYESHKASRSLRWMNNLGRVDLELELKDRTVQVQVTPLLAAVILLFQDKDTWNLVDICNVVKVPVTTLRRKMTYWLQQGVLKEAETDVFTVIEEQTGGALSPRPAIGQNNLDDLLEEDEDEVNSETENLKQKQQELIFWNYIQGMLMNFKSLPLDRIYKMLRMLAMNDSSMLVDQNKIRLFLNSKVQDGVLCIEAGKYRLNK